MKHKNCKLTVWKIQSLILMKKNVMKEKANELVRLHEAKLEKEQIQILALINGLKDIFQIILMYLNNLYELHMNQKVGGILAKFAPKKRKNYHH